MPEVYLKALKYSCMKDLNDELEKMRDIVSKTPTKFLLVTAQKMPGMAEKSAKEGDEEQAYILYMRFTHLYVNINRLTNVKTEDFKKVFNKSILEMCIKRAEELNKSLERRYKTLEEEKRLQNAAFEAVKTSPEVAVPPSNNFSGVTTKKPVEYTHEVTCIELNDLINRFRGTDSLLIMDVRPLEDFKKSHIDVPCIISVPEEIIQPGITCGKLEKTLPLESQNLWKTRINGKYVILVDWNSSLKTMRPMSHISHLKTILLKWDIGVKYERDPLILQKGYSEWLDIYPSITTNPRVEARHSPDDLFDLISLDDIDYPDFQTPLLPTQAPQKPQVYRTLKPLPSSPFPVVANAFVEPKIQETVPEALPNNAIRLPSVDRALKENMLEKMKMQQDAILKEALDKQNKLLEAEKNWEEFRKSKENEANEELQELKERQYIDTIEQLVAQCKKLDIENTELKIQMKNDLPEQSADLLDKKDEELEKMKAITSQMAKKRATQFQKITSIPPPPKPLQNSKTVDKIEKGTKPTPKFVPLNREPSESSNLSRSHSSPNIKDMDDDAPQFDRRIKPGVPRETFMYRAPTRDLSPVYGTKGPGLTGLKNLGNSCYMNSIVQCISNTHELMKYFCEGSYRNEVNTTTRTRGQIVEELAVVIRALWAGEYRTVACRDFKRVAGAYHGDFGGVRQQDSHEFLTLLMDWLHDDLNKKHDMKKRILTPPDSDEPPKQIQNIKESSDNAWREFEKCNDSRILHLFYGQQSSTVRCNSCSFESVTFEPFSTLTLVLPQNSDKCSLNECLSMYLAPEPIQEWRCPKCKQTRRATKKFDIWRLPPILVIHFKRFCEDIAWRKQHTLVEFPLQRLMMTQFTVNSHPKHHTYDLYAVSNHYGTMDGGHYTTYSRSAVFNKWYKFDDADVSEISEPSVRSNAAYILFYASQNMRSPAFIMQKDR
ncbi:ubiquitin carboxyl-terminal hydrolase 8 [Neocloeon triangulifer]|uniref:ubiquitin carboxyl-terminal hydrolase 8 n=1 Tax=Neocloeon triangulifer TaxID=2078957 RepID=UPI00286F9E1D|nr:ubiquitin carboxyl-terminal hydrolase 8 [Neocloeon triangulifer]